MSRDSQGDLLVPTQIERLSAWSWRLLVIAAAVALVAAFLWTLRGVTIPIFLALILSTAVSPVAGWLRRHGLPNALAVIITILGFALLVVGFLVAVVGTLISDFSNLGEEITSGTADVAGWVAANSGPLDLTRTQVEGYISDLRDAFGISTGDAVSAAVGGFSAFFGVVGGAFLAFAFLIYMLADGGNAARWLIARFPHAHQADAERIGDRAWVTMGGYLRGVTTVATFDAVLIGAGLFILGVPYAGALAALVFVLAYIPILGAWVSGAVAVVVAIADGGVALGAAVAVICLVVQQAEGFVVSPMVYRRSVQLHPIVTLAAVTGGGIAAGIVGALIAVPLTALVWAVVDESLHGGDPARELG